MNKNNKDETIWKKATDNLLIVNLYILIFGALFFIVSIGYSINGKIDLLNIFQKLWYPLFIPSLSLFFTAITIEVICSRFNNTD